MNGSDGGSRSRREPEAKRLDRNYNELLQELRVAQTGVQILFAFLLTIPFQNTFSGLSPFQHSVYLATLLAAASAVIMFIAPVATHRMMFRRGMKDRLVALTSRLAMAGLTFLSLAILGAILLVVDVVAARTPAIVDTAVTAAAIATVWVAVPSYFRTRDVDDELTDPPDGPGAGNQPRG
jgi:O-antigen/teichoic acid export membrane protein